MNKELEKKLKHLIFKKKTISIDIEAFEEARLIESALNTLRNSIPKEELKRDLEILEKTKVDDKEKFWMKSGIEEYLKKLLEGK